jgi:serine/threonine protein kinase
MLSNPNSEYFYNCDQLPDPNLESNDTKRGEIISRAFAFQGKINNNMFRIAFGDGSVYVVKVLPWDDFESHEEYRKYCQLSLISDKSYIFPNLAGWFDFKGLPFHWKIGKYNLKDERQLYLVYESLGSLRFEELEYEQEQFKQIFFILLHGLYVGRKFLNLNHGSLISNDIMFRRQNPPITKDFNIEGKRFIIENVEYVPVIVDFGYPTATMNQVRESSDLRDLERIFPMFQRLFRSKKWQIARDSYSDNYQVIVKILQSRYFSSSYLKKDIYIKPPIGAGTYNRVYKKVGEGSVVRIGIVNSNDRRKMFEHSQKTLKQIFAESEKYGPSLFREIRPGRWSTRKDEEDITIIDLLAMREDITSLYIHEIEYLEGDTLATDVLPNKMGCFSMIWFLYAGYYSNMRHRDIKPENCVIREYKGEEGKEFTFESTNHRYKFVTNRIPVFIDFDMVSLDPASPYRNKIGSLYTCPPGILIAAFYQQDLYDDKTYDWWSLGITIFSWYTLNVLSNFQQFTEIVKNFFKLDAEKRKQVYDETQIPHTELIIISTLIFYCHVNYIVFPEREDHIYGFLAPIESMILENFEKSDSLQIALNQYDKNVPVEIKILIQKLLSDDIEERVSNMEQTIFETFGEFVVGRGGGGETAEYIFKGEGLQLIEFSPAKSPVPKVETFPAFDFSPTLAKPNTEEEREEGEREIFKKKLSPYVYKKADFIESFDTISPLSKEKQRKATPFAKKTKEVFSDEEDEEEVKKITPKRVLF